ncbi:MAG: tRNA (adenosine(37)-N6)-threonylcarbamoyltransferase complex transferase subunit TsaD [Acidobacteriota bacterium]
MSPLHRRPFGKDQLILGIETSCDDTACALVAGDGRVVSSVVSSQLEAHRPFGGVVPEIASREHLRNWPAVSAEAFEKAGCTLDDVALVAATRGPGLVGSLLVGLTLGRTLAFARSLPFFGVHHLEGHLYSPFLDADGAAGEEPMGHFVGVVVSGGHSSFFDVRAGRVTTLGETRDDAIGEAFDKIGKRMGLPFPGGPIVDALAELVELPEEPSFPIPRCGDTLDVSYSGLKTQALQQIDRMERRGETTDLSSTYETLRRDGVRAVAEAVPALELLAAFRQAAVGQILDRLESYYAAHASAPEVVAVSGGVAANRHLRRELTSWAERRGLDLRLVPLRFSGDNAAMIAHAALLRSAYSSPDDPRRVEAFSRGSLGGDPRER